VKTALLLLLAAGLASTASAGAAFKKRATADWKPATHLPPGAEYELLYEQPGTHGVHALVRFPAGYSVPDHRHGHDETLTVVRGKLAVETEGKRAVLKAGDSVVLEAGTPHALKAATWFRDVLFTAVTDRPYDFLPVKRKRLP
jgi:quercetin dioxygenase-like cupin family protein